jgi:hypothetical protein
VLPVKHLARISPAPSTVAPVKTTEKGVENVLALIVVLLIAALLFGVGFAAHFLWILAAVVLVLWLVGFVARGSDAAWYRW